jgi:hypothetical protein
MVLTSSTCAEMFLRWPKCALTELGIVYPGDIT